MIDVIALRKLASANFPHGSHFCGRARLVRKDEQ
jgi:hypothetical protein